MDSNNTIDNFIKTAKDKKVVLFGAGNQLLNVLETITDVNNITPDYIVDNDFRKWYSNIWGYEIKEPLVLLDEDMDNLVVLITSMYPLRIEEQLKKMGVKHYYSSLLFLEKHIGQQQFIVLF